MSSGLGHRFDELKPSLTALQLTTFEHEANPGSHGQNIPEVGEVSG